MPPMQQPSSSGGRPSPSAPVARDGRRGSGKGTGQPWHALASTLVDVVGRGAGRGVSEAVVARASEGTGLSPGTLRGMMSAARYVRDSGHGGPVLASVDSVLALRRLASTDPDLASRLLGAVMAGQATRHDLLPGEPRARPVPRKPTRQRHARNAAPPGLSTFHAPPGAVLN